MVKKNKVLSMSEIQIRVKELNESLKKTNLKSRLLKENVYDINIQIKHKNLVILRGFTTEHASPEDLIKLSIPKKSRFKTSMKEILEALNRTHNLEKAAVLLRMSVTAIHHIFLRKKLKLVRRYMVFKLDETQSTSPFTKVEKIIKKSSTISAKKIPKS